MALHSHARRRSPLQLMLRLLMVVSLWQAPVPWLHVHAAHAESVASDVPLQRHLHRFHHEADGHELGWHLHFALPQDLFGDECEERESPGREPSPREPAADAAALVKLVESVIQGDEAVQGLVPMAAPGGVTPALPIDRPARNYFATFREPSSIRVLTCVARC